MLPSNDYNDGFERGLTDAKETKPQLVYITVKGILRSHLEPPEHVEEEWLLGYAHGYDYYMRFA